MLFPGMDMPMNTAGQRKARDAAFEQWAAEENDRIRRQRTYLTALQGTLRDKLVARMLERAWELLDANECEAADALLEFVPDADADKLLEEFFRETPPFDDPKETPKRMRCVGDFSEPYIPPASLQGWRDRRAIRASRR